MGLNLIGPENEAAFQAIERLAALKMSFQYEGGYYSGGPNHAGCDIDDMHDLDNELACATTEALPAILRLVGIVKERIHSDGSTAKTGHGSPFFAEIRKAADEVQP